MKKLLPTSTALSVNKAVNNPHGFTLIELLVVVSIIAFLAVIGAAAFSNAQAQARDGRRRADIDAIAVAMEANKDPLSMSYKNYSATLFSDNKLPFDPIDSGGYVYTTPPTTGTTSYTACAKLEKNNGNYSDTGTTPASGASATHYCRKNQQ